MTIDLSPEFGVRGRELLSGSNIPPRFEDTKYKETCPPDLFGQKEENIIIELIAGSPSTAHSLVVGPSKCLVQASVSLRFVWETPPKKSCLILRPNLRVLWRGKYVAI
jgi:hypothetical protein